VSQVANATILDTIVAHKRVEIAERKAARPLPRLLDRTDRVRSLTDALRDPSRPTPRVIAEIKRRSPSKGTLRPNLDPAQLARIYEQNGATAISVLTDSRFFGGSLDDLVAARRAVSLPVLCKEFIVDPYQILEAFSAGADAVLLIAAILDRGHLREYIDLCSQLGMDALVEVHNEAELRSAIRAEARIIGINNRDLRTFTVNMDTTRLLAPLVPKDVLLVSESGIRSAADRDELAAHGVDALLVGEGLITAPDIAAATREICGLHVEEVSLR
jgi:indole-3-glycerol phosphate synthase